MTNSTTLSPHHLLEGKVVAKLRFEKSERDPNTYIGFVSQDCITGQIFGRSRSGCLCAGDATLCRAPQRRPLPVR